MSDPIIYLYIALSDWFSRLPDGASRSVDRRLCEHMLTRVLVDRTVLHAYDRIEKVYQTSRAWLRLLDPFYHAEEIRMFYDTLHSIPVRKDYKY